MLSFADPTPSMVDRSTCFSSDERGKTILLLQMYIIYLGLHFHYGASIHLYLCNVDVNINKHGVESRHLVFMIIYIILFTKSLYMF